MTDTQKKRKSIETNLEMVQMSALFDEEFKIPIINMLKDLVEKVYKCESAHQNSRRDYKK